MALNSDELLATLRAENEALRRRVGELEQALAKPAPASDLRSPASDKDEAVPFQTLFEHLTISVAVYRPDGALVAMNGAACALSGVARDAMVGKRNILRDQGAASKERAAAFERAVRGAIARTPAVPAKTADSTGEDGERWMETLYVPSGGEAPVSWVMEMTLDITERHKTEQRMAEDAKMLRGIADHAPLFIYAKSANGAYSLWSRRCEELTGLPASAVLGRTSDQIFPKEVAESYNESDRRILESGDPENMEEDAPTVDGMHYFLSNRFPIRDEGGQIKAICGILTDITASKRAQDENRRLQEEMLRVQAETLRALSTPLIPIAQGVVAMPLIGAMTRERSQQVLETMLNGVAAQRARVAIFDVTGVPVADTEVVNALVIAAKAVRLLGAEVVLTGIRPEIAQTLVTLGVDLTGITTRSTLQSGIAYALRR